MPRKASKSSRKAKAAAHAVKSPADYITSFNMNGLEGRLLRLPEPGTKQAAGRDILFVYGLHSSLERWWGLALVLNRYGAVTMPDLPGFGGMDSFYKIGKKPTLDNMADYLAAVVKLRYRRKKVAIVGLSYGFVVVTRMLQKYPELTKKVTLLVSLVGCAHKDDFIFSKPRYYGYLAGTKLLSGKAASKIFREVALNPWILRKFYGHTHNAKSKYALAETYDAVEEIKNIEVGLWRNNDARTWAFTTHELLTLDNCKVRVNLPVWHVATTNDHYFDNNLVEQHMRVIFNDFDLAQFEMKAHAPSVLATEKDAAVYIPNEVRKMLRRAR